MHEVMLYITRSDTARGSLFEDSLLGPHGATVITALAQASGCTLEGASVDYRTGPGWIILRATWIGPRNLRGNDAARSVAEGLEVQCRQLRYINNRNLPDPLFEIGAERVCVLVDRPPPLEEEDTLHVWTSPRGAGAIVDREYLAISSDRIRSNVAQFLRRQNLSNKEAERTSAEIVEACAPDAA